MSHDYNTASQVIRKIQELKCFKGWDFNDERNFGRDKISFSDRNNPSTFLTTIVEFNFEKDKDFGIIWWVTTSIFYGAVQQFITVHTPLYRLDGGFYGYEGKYQYHERITQYMKYIDNKINELVNPEYVTN